jgi:hypothetical protein
MIIDLMAPRKKVLRKINDIIFDMKMNGVKLQRGCAASAIAMAMIAMSGERAMAMEQGVKAGESICQSVAPVIFGCAAAIHQSTPYDWVYLKYLIKSIGTRHTK